MSNVINGLRSFVSNAITARVNLNAPSTDSGYTTNNPTNYPNNSSNAYTDFIDSNSYILFIVMLLGLIYFLGRFTGTSTRQELKMETSNSSE